MVEQRAPDGVLEFLAKSRTPRKRATRKLADVLGRLANGEPPLDRPRSAWVFGSWARGAPAVGDIDLIVEVDETRDPGQQALDAYYRRAHPYAEIVKAMGCSGSSIVAVDVEPVFKPDPQPISPWRRKRLKASGQSLKGVAVPKLPPMGHVMTGDLFDPQPQLLWVRGDTRQDIEEQLARFPARQAARRHERTTTVAVIDDLLEKLGVETGFRLAAQIKAGNLAVRPFLIQPRGVPARIEDALSERYTPGSSRGYALGCALADLEDAGVAIEDVQLMRETSIGTMLDIEAWHAKFRRGIKNPKPPRPRSDPRPGTVVNVDFNAFIMYLIGAGRFDDGDRHIHIWPGSKKGPWLAVEVTGISSAGAQEIDRKLGMTRSEHIAGVRDELGLEPLPSQPSRGGGGARSGG